MTHGTVAELAVQTGRGRLPTVYVMMPFVWTTRR